MSPIQGRKCGSAALPSFVFACLFSSSVGAQGISVSAGSAISLGSGAISAGCGDLTVAGTLNLNSGAVSLIDNVAISPGTINGGSGVLSLSGNWTNSGTFNAQSSQINIVDDCGTATSTITGDNAFYGFSATSSAGKQLQFEAGATQSFGSSLVLTGSGSTRLSVRSTSPGSPSLLLVADGASQTIQSVDVADSDASGGAPIARGTPASFNSVDSGGLVNWFVAAIRSAPVPVNTLPLPLLILLIVLLAVQARSKFAPIRNNKTR